jgi:predicted amidohydrolase
LHIGLVQYSPVWENKEQSQSRIRQVLEGISNTVDLLVFPELTLTGFTMRSKRFAENINGATINFFLSLADTYSCHIIAGFIEVDKDMYFNTLVHLAPGENVVSKYRKIHPFSFTGENRHYKQGDRPVMTGMDGYSIGLSICYDLRFPELFRTYAKAGVDIIVNIANWPVDRIGHWYTLLKARAIENQCYMIGVNRVGSDKSIDYPGWSSVFHPFGQKLCCLKEYEGVKIQKIERKEVKNTRDKYPFLKDIRLV